MLHLALTCALAGFAETPGAPGADDRGRGELDWFVGSYVEGLREAERRDTLLLVEFWADWCAWCARHEAENLTSESVLERLGDFVCLAADLSVDSEGRFLDPAAAGWMNRFGIRRFPTLVFLRPDGTPEDLISGFLPADLLNAEIDRIQRGDRTRTYFERMIRDEPDELEWRYELALKLDALGDGAGYVREIQTIEARDPDGTSLPMRRMALITLREKLWGCMRDPELEPDPAELTSFLARETHAELLCDGWLLMGSVRDELGETRQSLRAFRRAWEHVAPDQVAPIGNGIAWGFWLQRERLTRSDKRFALEVARAASAAFEKISRDPVARAQYLDTLACCHYMAGDRSRAMELMRECMEAAPDVAEYRQHLELFETRG